MVNMVDELINFQSVFRSRADSQRDGTHFEAPNMLCQKFSVYCLLVFRASALRLANATGHFVSLALWTVEL